MDRGQLGRRSAGVADISIVPPAPSLNDRAVLTYTATGVISTTGVQVVAPPPSVQVRLRAMQRQGLFRWGWSFPGCAASGVA